MTAAEQLRARVNTDLARAKDLTNKRRQAQLEARGAAGDGDSSTTWSEPQLAAADVEAAFAAQYGAGEDAPGAEGDDAGEWQDAAAAAAAAASQAHAAPRGHGIRRGEAGHADAIFGTAWTVNGRGLLDEGEAGTERRGGGGTMEAAAAALAPAVLAAQSGLSWRERAALARAKPPGNAAG
jgi:hypothetical protein